MFSLYLTLKVVLYLLFLLYDEGEKDFVKEESTWFLGAFQNHVVIHDPKCAFSHRLCNSIPVI